MVDGYDIAHAIGRGKSRLGYHTLLTYYDESSPLTGAGVILCTDSPMGGHTSTCLSANCQLNAIWASPAGCLWAVDDYGDVFTLADVLMPAAPYSGLEFSSGKFDLSWKVGRIFDGQLNGIWGIADDDVWVTSFAGTVLHFDGHSWARHELPQAPTALKGTGANDLYVVGYHGNIHHWDGKRWSKLALPLGVRPDDAFTDIAIRSDGAVLICARSGALLIGSAQDGFIDVGSAAYKWYGIECLGNRVLLAGGEGGIFEYVDGQFVCLKDKGHPVAVFEVDGSLAFIPAEQKPRPWYVRYEPGAQREWTKVET